MIARPAKARSILLTPRKDRGQRDGNPAYMNTQKARLCAAPSNHFQAVLRVGVPVFHLRHAFRALDQLRSNRKEERADEGLIDSID